MRFLSFSIMTAHNCTQRTLSSNHPAVGYRGCKISSFKHEVGQSTREIGGGEGGGRGWVVGGGEMKEKEMVEGARGERVECV